MKARGRRVVRELLDEWRAEAEHASNRDHQEQREWAQLELDGTPHLLDLADSGDTWGAVHAALWLGYARGRGIGALLVEITEAMRQNDAVVARVDTPQRRGGWKAAKKLRKISREEEARVLADMAILRAAGVLKFTGACRDLGFKYDCSGRTIARLVKRRRPDLQW